MEENNFQLGIKRIPYNHKMRSARLAKGLTQLELADMASVVVNYITQIETIKRVPSVDEAQRIAAVLECDAKELFPDKLYAHLVHQVKSLKRDVIVGVEFSSLKAPDVLRLYEPKDVVYEVEAKDVARDALNQLNERERKMISLRFGLSDGVTRELHEVGAEFGITRERVRQIERKALDKIRKYFKKKKITWDGF